MSFTAKGEPYKAEVPPPMYKGYLDAPSKGAFFNIVIKPNCPVWKG